MGQERHWCAEKYFFNEKRNENHGSGAGFAVHKRISAVKKTAFLVPGCHIVVPHRDDSI